MFVVIIISNSPGFHRDSILRDSPLIARLENAYVQQQLRSSVLGAFQSIIVRMNPRQFGVPASETETNNAIGHLTQVINANRGSLTPAERVVLARVLARLALGGERGALNRDLITAWADFRSQIPPHMENFSNIQFSPQTMRRLLEPLVIMQSVGGFSNEQITSEINRIRP